MSKMFGNMTTDNMTEAQDSLGGFQVLASDIYDLNIKMMYVGQSEKGAKSMTILGDINGREYRETIYFTNRQGENFYVDKGDGKTRHPLPGFTTIDEICMMATGHPLSEMDVEDKMVKIYNAKERKEIPTSVPVLVDTMGKTIKVAILEIEEYKQKKNDAGVYVDTDELRSINEIDKAFHAETCRTVNEYKHNVEEHEFHDAWLKKNKGNKRTPKAKSGAGGAGASGSGRPGAAAEPKKSLFG